jgi:16S rRNA G527 N7-methylase RsmG
LPETPESILRAGLAELGAAPPAAAFRQLIELAELVALWGARINLTGDPSPETVVRRLILDAAALDTALPRTVSLVDLGSGAGFPGLPMAILEPARSVVLVEALRGRFEEIDPVPSETVVAQAVASPERLVEWMLRWSLPGGTLAVPGGTAARSAGAAGLSSSEVRTYRVPLGGPTRSLWVARAR